MAHSLIGMHLQDNLAICRYEPAKFLEMLLNPSPTFSRTQINRYRPTDYRGGIPSSTLQRIKEWRIKTINYKEEINKPNPTAEKVKLQQIEFGLSMAKLWEWSQLIMDRQGKVIFLRYPTPGETWELDQKLLPKKDFWDAVKPHSPVPMVHFHDFPEARGFTCPDTSHLNYDDGEKFTQMVCDLLQKHGL